MKCPQCGTQNPDDGWNCVSCRINLYWAVQHYDGLAGIRECQGLSGSAASPSFLVRTHREVMDERAQRGGPPENRVRALARKIMREKLESSGSADA